MIKRKFYKRLGYNYFGALEDINIWNPKVDLPNNFYFFQNLVEK